MPIRLVFNGSPEDPNTFRRHIQESLKAFNPKSQVRKAKLQTCPDPSKVGFIMYSANNLQVNLLVRDVLSVIKKEKNLDIEVAIQSELDFLTNEDRK